MAPETEKKSEGKQLRPLEQIAQEYNSLCAQAGNLQYEIDVKQKDLIVLNRQLRDLNTEYAFTKNTLEAEAIKKAQEEGNKTAEAPKAEASAPVKPKRQRKPKTEVEQASVEAKKETLQ